MNFVIFFVAQLKNFNQNVFIFILRSLNKNVYFISISTDYSIRVILKTETKKVRSSKFYNYVCIITKKYTSILAFIKYYSTTYAKATFWF